MVSYLETIFLLITILPNRNFCDDGNVLDLCCPRLLPLTHVAVEHMKCGSRHGRTNLNEIVTPD